MSFCLPPKKCLAKHWLGLGQFALAIHGHTVTRCNEAKLLTDTSVFAIFSGPVEGAPWVGAQTPSNIIKPPWTSMIQTRPQTPCARAIVVFLSSVPRFTVFEAGLLVDGTEWLLNGSVSQLTQCLSHVRRPAH